VRENRRVIDEPAVLRMLAHPLRLTGSTLGTAGAFLLELAPPVLLAPGRRAGGGGAAGGGVAGPGVERGGRGVGGGAGGGLVAWWWLARPMSSGPGAGHTVRQTTEPFPGGSDAEDHPVPVDGHAG
jgi:hypothetical protein